MCTRRQRQIAVLVMAIVFTAATSAPVRPSHDRACFAGEATDAGLIGHWPLAGDVRDQSPNALDTVNHGVEFVASADPGRTGTVAVFDGRTAWLEVPHTQALALGTDDFTFAAWIDTARRLTDVLGDVAAKFDFDARRGFNLTVQNYAGVTTTQSNYRHVLFGIDNAHADPEWTDCGRPGNNVFVFALAVYEGNLYAGTYEAGADEAGHVYRYAGAGQWDDCGSPDGSNSVMTLAVFDGQLYAGTANYHARGSALADSENVTPGGRVYRYEEPGKWVGCGRLGTADEVYSLCVFDGRLYGIPLYSQGVYQYQDDQSWQFLGTPGRRLMGLSVYNGQLLATGNEGQERGGVFRHGGGDQWIRIGSQAGVTQVYSIAVHRGSMYAGTWPLGAVFRDDGDDDWTNTGQLGDEREVMGMLVYNGKLYGGTLPLAQVYRYDGDGRWALTGRLDHTPDVRYRRAWSMAVYGGRLFCGTLPSGHVYSLQAGRAASHDRALEPGWRHLAAVRSGNRLRLFVDGRQVAESEPFDPADYDLTNDQPLRIGFGAHDYFNGKMSDVRLYGRALDVAEIRVLAMRGATQ